jgi:hypothetical protein
MTKILYLFWLFQCYCYKFRLLQCYCYLPTYLSLYCASEAAVDIHISLSHGQPFARAHRNKSKWPFSEAPVQVHSSHVTHEQPII